MAEPSAGGTVDAGAQLLVTDPELVVLDTDGQTITLWHSRDGRRLELGGAVGRLWQSFAVPRTLQSVLGPVPEENGEARDRIRQTVDSLRERGLLVRHEPVGTRVPDGRGGMFNAPVLTPAEALRGATSDVVFIGIPYDVGVTHRPGARFAPSFLRRVSGALFQYRDGPAGPPGMFDPVSGRQLLEAVRLADVGDVRQVVHSRNGKGLDQLTAVVRGVAGAGRLPVVLGGDHSVTWPVVRGLAEVHDNLAVLHFDAHSDYGRPRTDGWEENCHHGNVMDWVVGDERVRHLTQFGIRQLEHPPPAPHPKRRVWPGTSAAAAAPEELLAGLPEDCAYHVTVDVDCLDPTALPGTGTPLPGGFTHRELTALLELLCRNRRIVGLDVVEVLPQHSDVDGLVAADIVLRGVAAAMER